MASFGKGFPTGGNVCGEAVKRADRVRTVTKRAMVVHSTRDW